MTTSASTPCLNGTLAIKIGVIGAKIEELGALPSLLEERVTTKDRLGEVVFDTGKFKGIPTVFANTGIGKVWAAETVTELILKYNVTHVVMIGTAGGGFKATLKIGDVAIAGKVRQCDANTFPFRPAHQIRGFAKADFQPDEKLSAWVRTAVKTFTRRDFFKFPNRFILNELQITRPRLLNGASFATIDKFVRNDMQRSALIEDSVENGFHPDCVDLESGAVAQVCTHRNIPFAIIRMPSDNANRDAQRLFELFINHVAPFYAENIISNLFDTINQSRKPK